MTAAIGIDNLAAASGSKKEPAATSNARGTVASTGNALAPSLMAQTHSFRSSWQSLLGAAASEIDSKQMVEGDAGQTRAASAASSPDHKSEMAQTVSASTFSIPSTFLLSQQAAVPVPQVKENSAKSSAGLAQGAAKHKGIVSDGRELKPTTNTLSESIDPARRADAHKAAKKVSNATPGSEPSQSVAFAPANELVLNRIAAQPESPIRVTDNVSDSFVSTQTENLPMVSSSAMRAKIETAKAVIATAADVAKSNTSGAETQAGQTATAAPIPISRNLSEPQKGLVAPQTISAAVSPGLHDRPVFAAKSASMSLTPSPKSPAEPTPPATTIGKFGQHKAVSVESDTKPAAETLVAPNERPAQQNSPAHAAADHTLGGQMPGNHVANSAPQSVNPSLNSDPSPVHTAMEPDMRDAVRANSSGPVSNAIQTQAGLDAEASAVSPTWVRAGAHQAEAGFQDPALGWVAVRAQVDSSGVHASLVPSSADAAQSLGGHLAGLNAYLADHHTSVDSVTMAAPENHWAGQGMDRNSHQGANQRDAQGAEQQAGQGSQSSQRAAHFAAPVSSTERSLSSANNLAEARATASYFADGSRYISVVA